MLYRSSVSVFRRHTATSASRIPRSSTAHQTMPSPQFPPQLQARENKIEHALTPSAHSSTKNPPSLAPKIYPHYIHTKQHGMPHCKRMNGLVPYTQPRYMHARPGNYDSSNRRQLPQLPASSNDGVITTGPSPARVDEVSAAAERERSCTTRNCQPFEPICGAVAYLSRGIIPRFLVLCGTRERML